MERRSEDYGKRDCSERIEKTLKDPRVLETKSNPFKKLRKMFKRFF